MNTIKKLTRYTLYLVLAFVCLTSCDIMEGERQYNIKSWEIKQKQMELDYLKELYYFRSDIEFRHKLVKIDSLIANER